MKYLVFVDIDGVLASSRVHYASNSGAMIWSEFDPVAIKFFNRIHETYDQVEFVLISTWRDWLDVDNRHILLWIETAFRNSGFRGNLRYPAWKVNPEDDAELWGKRRAEEIKVYLKTPEQGFGYKDFIIFDDSDYGFNRVLGIKRFVQTDPDNGILFRHMRDASSIMGTWDKKGG